LKIGGADTAWRRQQRPNLASPDEAAPTDLDALELAGPRPAADGFATEADVGRGQQIRRFGEGDPVGGGSGHRRQSAEREPESLDELDEPESDEPDELEVLELSAFLAGAALRSTAAEPSLDEPVRSDEDGLAVLTSLDLASLVPPSLAPALSFERAALRALELRSFLAQPLPLKWTDGAENTLVIVPSAPHSGQKCGPSAAIPWTTSVRR
jgi:hypothetical protein